MKRVLLISLCLILWALSASVKAAALEPASNAAAARGFAHSLTGTAQLTDGTQIDFNMPLEFARGSRGWYFRAGSDYIFRSSPPTAYFLNLILDGQGVAYALDFSDQPITRLQLEVEGQEIVLSQTRNPDIGYGMRLRIDEQQFLFEGSHPRIRFELTEQGITHISAEHTLRDLSTRRAQ